MVSNEKYIQFEELNKDENVIHLFTKKPYNFNRNTLLEEEIDSQDMEIEKELGVKLIAIKRPWQTHSNVVKVLGNANWQSSFKGVDGLITRLKRVALATSVADCQAILLYDPVKKVIGNIHSGWKGTLNKIVVNAVTLMNKKFKCDYKDIKVYICPSILKCCFEVDLDVVEMFRNNFDDIEDCIEVGKIVDGKQKYYIDTVLINVKELKKLGVLEENITLSNICTKCNSSIYHSYRVDKDNSGRNMALICLK